MGGIGMGFTYSTTIACAQNWFPEKKGFVTGLIVSALGFGGVVFTPIIEQLITLFGGPQVGEPKTFMVLSGLFLKNPPQTESQTFSPVSVRDESLSPGQILKDPRFYIITLSLMLACKGGLIDDRFCKTCGQGIGRNRDDRRSCHIHVQLARTPLLGHSLG